MVQGHKVQKKIKLQCIEESQLCMICTKVEEVRAKKRPMVWGIRRAVGV